MQDYEFLCEILLDLNFDILIGNFSKLVKSFKVSMSEFVKAEYVTNESIMSVST